MAIADRDYAGVQNALADWMARDDLTPNQNKDAIALFEAEANRRLRTREMEASSLLTTSSGIATLPTDYVAWRGLTWNGTTSSQLEYAHPTMLRGIFSSNDAGIPAWFTIEGSNLTTRPIDDTADIFTLRYWQAVPALSDTNDTNWLLTDHFDLYLAGSLFYAYAFVRDTDAAGLYKGLMEEKFQQLSELSERTKEPAELRIVGVVV